MASMAYLHGSGGTFAWLNSRVSSREKLKVRLTVLQALGRMLLVQFSFHSHFFLTRLLARTAVRVHGSKAPQTDGCSKIATALISTVSTSYTRLITTDFCSPKYMLLCVLLFSCASRPRAARLGEKRIAISSLLALGWSKIPKVRPIKA